MKFITTIFVAFMQVQYVSSFTTPPPSPPAIKTTSIKPKTETFKFYGDIAPLGFFDPLMVTKNLKEKDLKYIREAELHHGRVAMISALILPLLDYVNKDELAVNVLYKSNDMINEACLFSMAMFELSRMVSVYKSPREKLFEIRDDVEPGQLNPYFKASKSENISNKELANGRLAMMGVLGYLVQELVTQQKIF
jgi:hypothetical protein